MLLRFFIFRSNWPVHPRMTFGTFWVPIAREDDSKERFGFDSTVTIGTHDDSTMR